MSGCLLMLLLANRGSWYSQPDSYNSQINSAANNKVECVCVRMRGECLPFEYIRVRVRGFTSNEKQHHCWMIFSSFCIFLHADCVDGVALIRWCFEIVIMVRSWWCVSPFICVRVCTLPWFCLFVWSFNFYHRQQQTTTPATPATGIKGKNIIKHTA